MLELKNIKKDYPAGGETVEALKGIDLQFRESEFVAVLGPSGCGKTTLLNIIGGLDQYTTATLLSMVNLQRISRTGTGTHIVTTPSALSFKITI